MSDSDIYYSLDEARIEIKKRWNNLSLRKEIENELGMSFWGEFQKKPRGLLWRQLISPDNGFTFFYQCSRYMNVDPLAFEFLGDSYMSFNEEKRGLGQLSIEIDYEKRAVVNIMDLHKWNKVKFTDIILKSGEKLIDFHHGLLDYSGYKIELKDMTEWVRKNGKPIDWYYKYLLHFIAHGVLFDAYLAENNEKSDAFFSEVVRPSLDKIKDKFRMKPLLVKHYPDNQEINEDFYWWSYPPNVNRRIMDYAESQKLKIRPIN